MGQEFIEAGVRAACIGGVAVLLFMLVYYGIAGLFADIVLVLNILLIMAGLAGFGATLTLPGIAGIILTIGMAVDANVLIFEHIREELRASLPPKLAVEEGFARATLTIVDANITTIIAAIVLYQFGTGVEFLALGTPPVQYLQHLFLPVCKAGSGEVSGETDLGRAR